MDRTYRVSAWDNAKQKQAVYRTEAADPEDALAQAIAAGVIPEDERANVLDVTPREVLVEALRAYWRGRSQASVAESVLMATGRAEVDPRDPLRALSVDEIRDVANYVGV